MKKQISREDRIYRFRLMLVLTFVALLAVAALITFSFLCVGELELLICLFVGIGMAALIVLTAMTVKCGLSAYRR